MKRSRLLRTQGVIWSITLPSVIGTWKVFLRIILLKVQLLKEYLTEHEFDIVCLSGTYLNSSFLFDDDHFDIPGHIMIRVDHPVNSKRGGECMCYKYCLPLKVLDIRFLHESMSFDLRIGDKLCRFISFTDHQANNMIITVFTVQTATISKAMIKFWYKCNIQILWYTFSTGQESF